METQDFATLAAQVRYLQDRQEILDCLNRYCRGLDRLDPELLASAYHPDALDNHYTFVGGVEAFVPYAIEIESRFHATHHGITSHNCEIDADSAHCESYVYWCLRRKDRDAITCGGGRYVDRFERRNSQWRIAVRRVFMDWSYEVSAEAWNKDRHWFIVGSRDRADASYARPLMIPADIPAEILAEAVRDKVVAPGSAHKESP